MMVSIQHVGRGLFLALPQSRTSPLARLARCARYNRAAPSAHLGKGRFRPRCIPRPGRAARGPCPPIRGVDARPNPLGRGLRHLGRCLCVCVSGETPAARRGSGLDLGRSASAHPGRCASIPSAVWGAWFLTPGSPPCFAFLHNGPHGCKLALNATQGIMEYRHAEVLWHSAAEARPGNEPSF
jgi:hypothetical protein